MDRGRQLLLLGKHIPTTTSALTASRVKSNNPRSIRRYQWLLRNQYMKYKFFKTTKKLAQELKTFLATTIATTDKHATFLASFKEKLNTHHKQTRQIRQSVDKKCDEYSQEVLSTRHNFMF
jgi:hypothetical protein